MSLKNHPYTGLDDPRIPRRIRALPPEAQQSWVDSENAFWAPVATCKQCPPLADGSPRKLASFEVEPHKLAHIESSRVRQIMGMVLDGKTTDADRAELKKLLR